MRRATFLLVIVFTALAFGDFILGDNDELIEVLNYEELR